MAGSDTWVSLNPLDEVICTPGGNSVAKEDVFAWMGIDTWLNSYNNDPYNSSGLNDPYDPYTQNGTGDSSNYYANMFDSQGLYHFGSFNFNDWTESRENLIGYNSMGYNSMGYNSMGYNSAGLRFIQSGNQTTLIDAFSLMLSSFGVAASHADFAATAANLENKLAFTNTARVFAVLDIASNIYEIFDDKATADQRLEDSAQAVLGLALVFTGPIISVIGGAVLVGWELYEYKKEK